MIYKHVFSIQALTRVPLNQCVFRFKSKPGQKKHEHTHTYIALLNFGVKYVIVNETRDILSSGQFL